VLTGSFFEYLELKVSTVTIKERRTHAHYLQEATAMQKYCPAIALDSLL